MQHVYLFYLFITLFTGVISLGIVIFLYTKTRDALIGYYLAFYLVFTAVVLSNTLATYIELNIPSSPIEPFVKYFFAGIARFALLFSVPVFVHYIGAIPNARKKNIILAGLTLTMAIAYPILESTPHDIIEDYGDLTIDVIFMGVMVYTLVVGLSAFGKFHDPARERLLRKFLMVFGSLLPGVLVDTLLSEFFSIPIQIFPILYCGFSIVFSHHFLKHYTAQHIHAPSPVPSKTDVDMSMSRETENATSPLSKPSMPESSEDALFLQYEISPREQEVTRLIVQGCSNQQIAETLFISVNTVKAHIKKIYVKFGVKSRYELISLLKDRGGSNPKG